MDGPTAPTEPDHDQKIVEKEEAAHEKRNWVRLTYDCNDHCIFCLDSHTHNGTNRDRNEIKEQILDGRRKGAQRLILSGGEPTIHPNFVDFVKLGRMAGYRKVQTVTNGRMFAYKDFLQRSLDAGLSEITFSIHGSNARIHDALVGTKGAFEEEIKGLENALADGRPIINIDVCVNRGNVKTLPDLLEKFTNMGVLEYDLLHVIPFGRAYTEGKETLFYDLEEMRPYLLRAFEYSKKPGMHIWLNRFPPQHLEGFEHLIQDPYKLNDEIRGRKEEYATLLEYGVPLDCRAPDRCRHCYLEPVCDTLDEVRGQIAQADFGIARLDTEWEANLPAIYGGDPASKRRSAQLRESMNSMNQIEAESASSADATGAGGKLRLPLLGRTVQPEQVEYRPLPALVEAAGARTLWIVAPGLAAVEAALQPYDPATVDQLELELPDPRVVLEALDDTGRLFGRRLTRVLVSDPAHARVLLAAAGEFEIALRLSRRTEPWLLQLAEQGEAPARLVIVQPTHERLTESQEEDVVLPEFFSRFELPVPVENVPSCVIGRAERQRPAVLDTTMMTPDGELEIFRYIRRYIEDRFWTKSLRCKQCAENDRCRGMHINYVRAHGYAMMQPLEQPAS